jgi:hypothetical protein
MKPYTALLALIFLLVLVAAGTGVFYQTPGAPIAQVTVRGEHATYQGSGLYRYDPISVAREGVIWDAIDLVLALPLFAAAVVVRRRAMLRGQLLLGGVLFYFAYKYLMYATMVAFNPLFLVYIAIFALGGVAFFVNLHGVDVAGLPDHIAARFPRRLCIGFTLAMSTALLLLWIGGRILPYTLAGRFPDEFAGVSTLETQALDLGLVVPLLLTTTFLLWRRAAWGYLLAGISLTFGLIMSITLPAWIAVPLIQDGTVNVVEASPLLLLCAVGILVAGSFFWNVQESAARAGNMPVVGIP